MKKGETYERNQNVHKKRFSDFFLVSISLYSWWLMLKAKEVNCMESIILLSSLFNVSQACTGTFKYTKQQKIDSSHVTHIQRSNMWLFPDWYFSSEINNNLGQISLETTNIDPFMFVW